MPINWAEKYINRMINGKSLEEKVRISLQEYLANKSKVFKLLNSCLYEIVVDITEYSMNNPDVTDLTTIDVIVENTIIAFNAERSTLFDIDETPIHHSSGAIFTLKDIGRGYFSKIQEVPILDPDTNWGWTLVNTFNSIDETDADSIFELGDSDLHEPEIDARTYEYDTVYCERTDGSGGLYIKYENISFEGDGIGVAIAYLPEDVGFDVDDVLIDLAQVLQNSKILESSIMVMNKNSVSYSDMRQIAVSNNAELTNESENYLQSVFSVISDSNQSLITKISALLSPNIDAIQNIGDDPTAGLVIAEVDMGNFTGISPFNAFKNSIDVNISASGLVSGIAIGVKAIGKAASWLWRQAVNGVNYVVKAVDENVINAKDFGVANKNSNDLFFDVPLLQGIVTNDDISFACPEILEDAMTYPLFSDSEISDKFKSEGGVIEIPTNAGSIFLSWDGEQYIYQVYLIPTTPLVASVSNIPIPFFFSPNTGTYANEGKSYRWYLETVIGDDVSIDPTEEHTDLFWYRALQASRVRMEYFLWILYNHGKDLETLLDMTSFTTAFIASNEQQMFGKFRNVNGAVVNGTDYLFTDANNFGYVYSGLTLSEAVELDADYYVADDFEPTNNDFMSLVSMSQNYVTQAAAGSGPDPASLIIRGIANLISINSYEGMVFTLSTDGVVAPFIPYIHRNTPIDPRYSISTDDDNGDVIGKIILAAAIVTVVVTAMYFGLKLRTNTRKKISNLSAQVDSYQWELSQMPLNDSLRNDMIIESVKLQKKLKRTQSLGKLLGLGVTSIAPAAALSAIMPDDTDLRGTVTSVSTRIGGL